METRLWPTTSRGERERTANERDDRDATLRFGETEERTGEERRGEERREREREKDIGDGFLGSLLVTGSAPGRARNTPISPIPS